MVKKWKIETIRLKSLKNSKLESIDKKNIYIYIYIVEDMD